MQSHEDLTKRLPPTVRRRGLIVLLAGNFLMFGGFFMLVPLISIHYVNDLHFAAAAVGIVLATRQLTQQGLTLFGGALADRWGPKGLLCWGLAIRAVAFAGLAWANSFISLLLLCVLAALGGALFDAPGRAAVAVLTEPAERARFFSLNGVVGGIGMTIGPLLGSLLLNYDFKLVCFAAGFCFALAAIVTVIWLPHLSALPDQSVMHGISLAAHDRPFVVFTALLAGFWFMWVQISISMPLVAQRWVAPTVTTPFGPITINGVAWVHALNAVLIVVLQYPLLRLAERWLRPLPILIVGMALMALGLGLIAVTGSLGMLLGCVALFSIGALLVQPTQQTVTAAMADQTVLGSYFGFNALALAFGGGLGNYMGGWLYDAAQRWQFPALPWLVFAGVGFTVTLGLLLLDRAQTKAQTRSTLPQQASSAS
jgi:DHA1 family multidrug resistance protein-like MFS transporter